VSGVWWKLDLIAGLFAAGFSLLFSCSIFLNVL
jgi:hypothetical protein